MKRLVTVLLVLAMCLSVVGTAFADDGNASCFTDVNGSNDKSQANYQYFYDAVYWASENGITNGVSDNLFGVGQKCTRVSTMIFLWRYMGSPKPERDARNYFKDLSSYGAATSSNKAIAWAYENGICKGYGDNTFRPNNTITRKEVLILLYRCAAKPTISSSVKMQFSDCKNYAKSSDTYKAIAWGTSCGITAGYSDGTFKPNANCLREQVVTFLYRYNKAPLETKLEELAAWIKENHNYYEPDGWWYEWSYIFYADEDGEYFVTYSEPQNGTPANITWRSIRFYYRDEMGTVDCLIRIINGNVFRFIIDPPVHVGTLFWEFNNKIYSDKSQLDYDTEAAEYAEELDDASIHCVSKFLEFMNSKFGYSPADMGFPMFRLD